MNEDRERIKGRTFHQKHRSRVCCEGSGIAGTGPSHGPLRCVLQVGDSSLVASEAFHVSGCCIRLRRCPEIVWWNVTSLPSNRTTTPGNMRLLGACAATLMPFMLVLGVC